MDMSSLSILGVLHKNISWHLYDWYTADNKGKF